MTGKCRVCVSIFLSSIFLSSMRRAQPAQSQSLVTSAATNSEAALTVVRWGEAPDEPALARPSKASKAREDARPTGVGGSTRFGLLIFCRRELKGRRANCLTSPRPSPLHPMERRGRIVVSLFALFVFFCG